MFPKVIVPLPIPVNNCMRIPVVGVASLMVVLIHAFLL